MKKIIMLLFMLACVNSYAAETNQTGLVSNITSIKGGLLIMLDTGKPSGCSQSSPWMLIAEENKTMIAVALAMYSQGKKAVTVYIDRNAPGSYCRVIQYDPH